MEDDIKQARKIGGSTILPLTGFIEDRKYYKVSRIDNTTIIIKEAKIVVDWCKNNDKNDGRYSERIW